MTALRSLWHRTLDACSYESRVFIATGAGALVIVAAVGILGQ